MRLSRPLLRPDAWPGTLARLLAFALLVLLLGMAIALVWDWVAPDPTAEAVLLGHAVLALTALSAGALLIRVVDGRPAAALGIGVSRETPRHLALGLAIGIAGLGAAAAALVLTGALRYSPQEGTAAGWLAVVLTQAGIFTVAAFAEEALFRGYPLQVLTRAGGPVLGTVVTAVLFALAHGRNPELGMLAMVNIFLAGVLLAIAYLRTLSLWFATALHTGWNWAMATLFDLPVSGIQAFDTPLYQPAVGGPGWWSGAAFGPEGGLVGTLGFAVALAAVLRLVPLRPDPRIAAAGPLVLDRAGDPHEG